MSTSAQRNTPTDMMRGWLKGFKKNRSEESNGFATPQPQPEPANNLLGERKINNQNQPDVFYTSSIERLSVGIANWTVANFRVKQPDAYTDPDLSTIRSFLLSFSRLNPATSNESIWETIDLRSALSNSKFRLVFVLHIIGLYFHQRVFSSFSYEITSAGVSRSLKFISDQVLLQGHTE
jgi:hypothetical protein